MGKISVGDAVQIRLERLLQLHSISKAELARRAGLPSRTVENYFKGHSPSAEALFQISRGMNVPVDWLLGDLVVKTAPVSQEDFDPLKECVVSAAYEILSSHVERGGTLDSENSKSIIELALKIGSSARQKMNYFGHALTDEQPSQEHRETT
ncbi:helix-turn-helix domain-containing protein [Paracoccus sanguinis]|uniref:helix-turn-helix domain-containing protein n=1 Tax=Paracoccus sanguinis TaxID=1545044 RepID=UPI0009DF9CF8|nr:helix-turn-helix transcriptional regulator [Paracoccus sanguinis]